MEVMQTDNNIVQEMHPDYLTLYWYMYILS